MLSIAKKILAVFIITVFVSSIPLVFAENQQSDLVKVVVDIKVDDLAKGVANAGGKGVNSGYILSGPKWTQLPVNIVVDSGMTITGIASVRDLVYAAANTWDSATTGSILGTVSTGAVTKENEASAPDNVNEIYFDGTFSNNGIIAQTTYWYSRRGGQMLDFDIVFNTHYTWADVKPTTVVTSLTMDFQNIATHELGHGFGLSDLYQAKYSAQTMYGYASASETSKRTLESGDIAGIQALYG
jgi:hypothetical protein